MVLREENWSTLGKTCCSRINSQQIQPSNCDCSPTEATFLPLVPFFYFVIIMMLMIMVMMKMILLTTVAITMFKLLAFPLNCSSKDKVLCTISPQPCRLSLYFSNFVGHYFKFDKLGGHGGLILFYLYQRSGQYFCPFCINGRPLSQDTL